SRAPCPATVGCARNCALSIKRCCKRSYRPPCVLCKPRSPAWAKSLLMTSNTLRAWVRENNPQVYVKGCFDVTHIPKGDPDCRLGVKKSTNQVQPDGSKKVKKVSLAGLWH